MSNNNFNRFGCLLAVMSFVTVSLFMPVVIIALINYIFGFEMVQKNINSYMVISALTIAVFLLWVIIDSKKQKIKK
jgi:hypothetical protein